ncbi:RimJ/RimL family protein N-acetyltransferase [Novosphingobium hassiacum]|uniref:RimJ/RimL family protein N-acetyltransferase n=1 Tax=Novosphingobium hassiacum TaxID=173676 RepID=A0A7W6A0A8_9SPHN|nr:GNAT family N-acetyltransferase [Novosphingobium hassiacum]MBB3861809.1 RimJ/RimL family protein N-acetyltransferase [Novosphingobium hassiacum]
MSVRLTAATAEHFAQLIAGEALTDGTALAATPVAEAEVLAMLAEVADVVGRRFSPAAWLMISRDDVVGLLSITEVVEVGVVQIGYGVAPGSRGHGHAADAVAALLEWARGDGRLHAIVAETRTDNIASQRVLERNGFARIGERLDEEDGDLFCWRAEL